MDGINPIHFCYFYLERSRDHLILIDSSSRDLLPPDLSWKDVNHFFQLTILPSYPLHPLRGHASSMFPESAPVESNRPSIIHRMYRSR